MMKDEFHEVFANKQLILAKVVLEEARQLSLAVSSGAEAVELLKLLTQLGQTYGLGEFCPCLAEVKTLPDDVLKYAMEGEGSYGKSYRSAKVERRIEQQCAIAESVNWHCPKCGRLCLNPKQWVTSNNRMKRAGGPLCKRCWFANFSNRKLGMPPRPVAPPADGKCPRCQRVKSTARRHWALAHKPVICHLCASKEPRVVKQ